MKPTKQPKQTIEKDRRGLRHQRIIWLYNLIETLVCHSLNLRVFQELNEIFRRFMNCCLLVVFTWVILSWIKTMWFLNIHVLPELIAFTVCSTITASFVLVLLVQLNELGVLTWSLVPSFLLSWSWPSRRDHENSLPWCLSCSTCLSGPLSLNRNI